MSILLVGLGDDLLPSLIRRLTEQGDEVRVLEAGEEGGGRWSSMGAHVASGPRWDADLVERAAQNVRTIVVGDSHDRDPVELMDAVIEGGGFASREMRLVVLGEPQPRALDALRASKLAFVVLKPKRRGLLGRGSALPPEALAEAVDAADDLAGDPRLELDLGEPDAWRELRLTPPP